MSAPVARPLPAEIDFRDPMSRLAQLLGRDQLVALNSDDGSGVRTARGTIHGVPVIAYCTDATKMGGALGAKGSRWIVEAIELAVAECCPVIGVWHSGG